MYGLERSSQPDHFSIASSGSGVSWAQLEPLLWQSRASLSSLFLDHVRVRET